MSPHSELARNYELFFAFVKAHGRPGGRILDYGCGDGALVEEGQRRGFDIVGVDNFYGDSDQKPPSEHVRLLEPSGRIPWDDDSFDVLISNQVIEHVEYLNLVASEIRRVANRDAVMLHVFPTRDYLVEGHIGLPIVHWLDRFPRLRASYTKTLRRAGLGFDHFEGNTPEEWATSALSWMDTHVFYRSWREVSAVLGQDWEVASYTIPQLEWLLEPKTGRAADAARFLLRSKLGRETLERVQHLRIGRAVYCRRKFAWKHWGHAETREGQRSAEGSE